MAKPTMARTRKQLYEAIKDRVIERGALWARNQYAKAGVKKLSDMVVEQLLALQAELDAGEPAFRERDALVSGIVCRLTVAGHRLAAARYVNASDVLDGPLHRLTVDQLQAIGARLDADGIHAD